MQLSQARAFYTGGTLHIIINNQVGFTTHDPRDTRSTMYCSDVAKMLEAPIFHVNGDDPEAVCHVARLALAPMTNDFVAMLKDSSLVSVLTVLELTKETQIFATNIGSWVVPGLLCAGLYLAMSLPLARLSRRLERRWGKTA